MSEPRLSARVLVPDGCMRETLSATARALASDGRPLVVTWRSYRALTQELGGDPDAAAAFLIGLPTETGVPVFLNSPMPGAVETQNQTVIIAPPGWSNEKAGGYLAGMKDELETEFGRLVGRPHPLREPPSNRRERRRRHRA